MEQLEGKTAVVTGAASGMGRAFADRFAAAGMKVVLADVEEPALSAAVEEIGATGVEAIGVVTDVAEEAALQRLADVSVEAFGQVNVVCNNAGVAGASITSSPGDLSTADWKWVLDVNLWGVIYGHKAFLPHLLEHGDGHIVNTASMAGHFPGHSAYTASKWAVVGITEGLFYQLSMMESSIGVSCLCPGWVDTRIADSVRNRPEWAAPDALAAGTADEEAEARMAFVRDQLASGMAPADVANLVHDAIVNDQFWIFTDTAMTAVLEDRFASVLENRNPVPPAPLIGSD